MNKVIFSLSILSVTKHFGVRHQCFLSAAQHLPVGHRLRPVAVSDLCHVHLQGHGMGQRVHETTQHDRIPLVQIHRRGIVAVGTVHEINRFSSEHTDRKHWSVSLAQYPICMKHHECIHIFCRYPETLRLLNSNL